MRASVRTELTNREREEFENEKEIATLQAEYGLKLKSLELDIKRTEVRWNQVWRLPMALILLPIKLVMAVGYVIQAARGKETSDKFWEFMWK